MNDIHAAFRQQGLIRPREGRVLGGVIAGLGRRFGIDPWPARLLFIVILMVLPGSQLLVYPILWILMPAEQPAEQPAYPPAAPGYPPAYPPVPPTYPAPSAPAAPTYPPPSAAATYPAPSAPAAPTYPPPPPAAPSTDSQ